MTSPLEDKKHPSKDLIANIHYRFEPQKQSFRQRMYFGKEIFTDANENVFYSILKNFKIFNLYHAKIYYTINYDIINQFGQNNILEDNSKSIMEINMLF